MIDFSKLTPIDVTEYSPSGDDFYEIALIPDDPVSWEVDKRNA